jgi:hypothetical protein
MSEEVKEPEFEKFDKLDMTKPMDRVLRAAVISVLVIVVVLLGAALLLPVRHHGGSSKNTWSLSNVKQHALALAMYSTDFDDRLPEAEGWIDLSMPYSKNEDVYVDPLLVDRKPGESGYAFFLPMSGVDSMKVEAPDKMPMTFQSSDLSRNANGYLDLLPNRLQKRRGNIVSFIDAHAKVMSEDWRYEVIVVNLEE